jgi:hypothetical protein
MRDITRKERFFGTLLMLVMCLLFVRLSVVKWWLMLPVSATLLICYWLKVRKPFTVMLVVAAVMLVFGFLF